MRIGAAFPVQNHAWPESEILIEGTGDPSGELKEAQLRAGLLEVTTQLGKGRLSDQRREESHDSPGQIFARVKAGRRLSRQSIIEEPRDKSLWKEESDVSANSMGLGEPLGEPASHAGALHHDRLRLENSTKRLGHDFGQGGREFLESIAGVEMQAGHRAHHASMQVKLKSQ